MSERIPLDELTSDALDNLYDRLDTLTRQLRDSVHEVEVRARIAVAGHARNRARQLVKARVAEDYEHSPLAAPACHWDADGWLLLVFLDGARLRCTVENDRTVETWLDANTTPTP